MNANENVALKCTVNKSTSTSLQKHIYKKKSLLAERFLKISFKPMRTGKILAADTPMIFFLQKT